MKNHTSGGIELRKAAPEEYPRLKALYVSSFPKEERAPFRILRKRAEQGRADFWSLYDNDMPVGMAYVISHASLAYLFYFVVDPHMQDHGCGTETIRTLRKKYAGYNLFLALESLDPDADNNAQRIRRHRFYESCGLHDLPYYIKEASVTYSIMGTGDTVQPEEYRKLIRRFTGPLISLFVDMRILKEVK